MHDASTQSQCSATTWRDGVEREVGGRVQDGGDKFMPMADSC